jgi:hypothetical protein
MIRHILSLLLLAATAPVLKCQPIELNPLHVHDGLQAARQHAIEILAADAVPVFIGAVGDMTYNANGMIVPLRFHLENGSSTAWAYSFYSPSLKRRELIVAIDIPDLGLQAIPTSSPMPIPELTVPVDMTLTYARSDRMIERLKQDSIYSRYRAEHPAMLPEGIALHMPDAVDSATVPSWFPLDRPVWTMNFVGEGNREMVCYVAAGSGATYCTRALAASVGEERRGGERMELSKR